MTASRETLAPTLASPPDTVAIRSFEGLLILGCERDPVLLEEARKLGVDFDSDRTWFTSETWRQCLDLVRVHRFGSLPPAEGFARVGQLFVEGYCRTLVGRVFAGAVRMIGPDRALARAPRYFQSARKDLEVRMELVAPREWRVYVEDSLPNIDFMKGILTAILTLVSATAQFELLDSQPQRYVLALRWSPIPR